MDATALLDSTGALLPHMTVLVTGLVILTLDLFLTPRSRYLNEVVGLIGLLVAFLFTLSTTGAPRQVFMAMAVVDYLGAFFNATFLLIAALTILLSASYVRREGVSAGEYYALIFFATTGFMFVAAAADLIMVFLAIETLSIATYILAGLLREDPRSQEAAFKYFMLGALSSAFFLYGIATIYGALGNTNLVNLAQALGQGDFSPLLLMGMALLIVGLGFKAAVVPFHMWAPDVYEGAPTTVTAFMTAGPKAAAFAAFLRVFFQGFTTPEMVQHWAPIFAFLAALTMILGNFVALAQQSLKRMLAYSSIAHAGYAFVALVAHNALGASSILYYLVAYTLMSLGAFTVLMVVARRLRGLGDHTSSVSGDDGAVYVRPRRFSAYRRICGQVLCVQCRGAGGLLRVGPHWGPDQRGLGRVLHPCGHAHVHARAKRGATVTASGSHNDGSAGNYGGRDSVYGDLAWGAHASRRTCGGVSVPGKNVTRQTVAPWCRL